jgi:hypothetical protein
MTRTMQAGLILVGVVVIGSILNRAAHHSDTSGTTTTMAPAAEAEHHGVLASGGLACRSRTTYLRIWKQVASQAPDSMAAWASRHKGCRRLDEDGEPVERLELVSRSPQVAEVWLVGDTLPWFVHWAAIDTLPVR